MTTPRTEIFRIRSADYFADDDAQVAVLEAVRKTVPRIAARLLLIAKKRNSRATSRRWTHELRAVASEACAAALDAKRCIATGQAVPRGLLDAPRDLFWPARQFWACALREADAAIAVSVDERGAMIHTVRVQ